MGLVVVAGVVSSGLGALDGLQWMPIFAVAGLLYGAVLWGVICLVSFLLLPGRARRLFRQQRSIHQAYEYRWSDAALTFSSATASGNTPWPDFSGYRETKAAFLIYRNDAMFEFLPLEAFTKDAADDLRATLAGSGLPVY